MKTILTIPAVRMVDVSGAFCVAMPQAYKCATQLLTPDGRTDDSPLFGKCRAFDTSVVGRTARF